MGKGTHLIGISMGCLLGLITLGVMTHHEIAAVYAATATSSNYAVNYVSQSDSGNAASVKVTIKNTGKAAVNGWKLVWNFKGNQKLTSISNASFTQSGTKVTVQSNAVSSKIAAGGTVFFTFLMTYSGTNAEPASFTFNGKTSTVATATPVANKTPTAVATPTPTANTAVLNPDDYAAKTTVKVLAASAIDISKRTQEFKGLVKGCTKVAYAYADPKENADASLNSSQNGAKSRAVYIFGYDNTTTVEFLNTKKWVPYVLHKLYYDSKLRNTWYKTLVSSHGVYIILEKPENMDGYQGVKFGNNTDGFGMRLGAGCMANAIGRSVLFHEMAHCIWDTTATTKDFYVGVDSRTGINYGTGSLLTLFNKLYTDSIAKNTFYAGSYGWDYSHENFAESAARFFTKSFQTQLLANDPVVYNIMNQIFTKFNF